MPLILNRRGSGGTQCLVWKSDESEDELLSLLSLRFRAVYASALHDMRSRRRRVEWITSKVLLHAVAGITEPLVYDAYGAPALTASELNVSISHSGSFVFVALSPRPIGVDVQKASYKLERVSDAFLNAFERASFGVAGACGGSKPAQPARDNAVLRKLMLVWSAKEAVCKLCGIHDLDLKNNVTVNAGVVARYGFTTASVCAPSVPCAAPLVVGIKHVFAAGCVFAVAEYLHR